MIRESKKSVIFTGAGISTSAGVADFRGPNGVWTAERQGKPPPPSADFDQALPTATVSISYGTKAQVVKSAFAKQ